MHQRYKDRGLRVILVSEDALSTAQAVPSFLPRYNITAKWQIDSDSKLLARYNVSANIPYTVLLDANGTPVWAHAGYESRDEVELEKQIAARLLPTLDCEDQAVPANDKAVSMRVRYSTEQATTLAKILPANRKI